MSSCLDSTCSSPAANRTSNPRSRRYARTPSASWCESTITSVPATEVHAIQPGAAQAAGTSRERHLVSGLLRLRPSAARGAHGTSGLPDPCGAATSGQPWWNISRIYPHLHSPRARSLPGVLKTGGLRRSREPDDDGLAEQTQPAAVGRTLNRLGQVDRLPVRAQRVPSGPHDVHRDVIPPAPPDRAIGRRAGHEISLLDRRRNVQRHGRRPSRRKHSRTVSSSSGTAPTLATEGPHARWADFHHPLGETMDFERLGRVEIPAAVDAHQLLRRRRTLRISHRPIVTRRRRLSHQSRGRFRARPGSARTRCYRPVLRTTHRATQSSCDTKLTCSPDAGADSDSGTKP